MLNILKQGLEISKNYSQMSVTDIRATIKHYRELQQKIRDWRKHLRIGYDASMSEINRLNLLLPVNERIKAGRPKK